MTEAIFETDYWATRLKKAKTLHHAIFRCPQEKWDVVAEKHQQILEEHIQPTDRILDAGCGWGRLLSLLPESFEGSYTGIDISPDFIDLARHYSNGEKEFHVCDLRDLPPQVIQQRFDWGICISIRPMIIRNSDQETWDTIEKQLHKCCKRILFLEYDETDEGAIL